MKYSCYKSNDNPGILYTYKNLNFNIKFLGAKKSWKIYQMRI